MCVSVCVYAFACVGICICANVIRGLHVPQPLLAYHEHDSLLYKQRVLHELVKQCSVVCVSGGVHDWVFRKYICVCVNVCVGVCACVVSGWCECE